MKLFRVPIGRHPDGQLTEVLRNIVLVARSGKTLCGRLGGSDR
jgi:hypothetical protein